MDSATMALLRYITVRLVHSGYCEFIKDVVHGKKQCFRCDSRYHDHIMAISYNYNNEITASSEFINHKFRGTILP